jgi:hypothetical protein
MKDLQSNETVVAGQWVAEGERVVANEACKRIEWLVTSRLERVPTQYSSGWETLFRDPRDGRLWERTYPHGEWHGGGPPQLQVISSEAAASKYGAAA